MSVVLHGIVSGVIRGILGVQIRLYLMRVCSKYK